MQKLALNRSGDSVAEVGTHEGRDGNLELARPSQHDPGNEIPEKHWMYRFAKKHWFFGFGAYT